MAEARLTVILSVIDRATNQLKSVNRTLAQNQDLLKKVSLAATAFSIASVIAIRSFARAALDSRQAQLLLQTVIKNTGASFEEFWPIIDTTIKNLTKFSNYTDEELKGALSDLIIALGDVPLAIAALPVAMNAAAAAGVSVGDMATQVARFIMGETDTIRALGITIDKDVTNPLERLAFLMDKVKGAAEANIDPFKQLSNAFGELKETIGTKVLEILEPLLKRLTDLAVSINENVNPALLDIGVKVWLVATAFTGVTAALTAFLLVWPTVQAALGIMYFLLFPLGPLAAAVAIALALLASGDKPSFFEWLFEETKDKPNFLDWLSEKLDRTALLLQGKYPPPDMPWLYEFDKEKPTFFDWLFGKIYQVESDKPTFFELLGEKFKNTVLLFQGKLPGFEFAWPEIKLPELSWGTILTDLLTAWKVCLFNLEALRGIAATVLKTAWDTFWPTLKDAIDTLKARVEPVWKAFMDGLGTIFKPAANAIIGLAEGMANGVIAAVNAMINALNRIQVPDWVWGIGGKGINISPVASVTIPRLAEGGIVTTPTLAMIGERGPEAVIPLRGQRGGLVINFNGPVYGFEQFEKKIGQAVRDIASRGGFYGVRIGA